MRFHWPRISGLVWNLASALQVGLEKSRRRDLAIFNDQFSGVLLLAHSGQPVLARAYGMANKQLSIPNTVETVFAGASLGKIFTGIAIGQLASEGKVDPRATLGTYVDGFPAEVANSVTLHQMFTHTSGMDNYQNSPVWQAKSRQWTSAQQEFDDTMAIIKQQALLFSPGTGYNYSNSGYYVLGAIAAEVSGETFPDYVREQIFVPAGMSNAGYYPSSQWKTNPDFAHAYGPVQSDGTRPDITARSTGEGVGGGAGGAFFSAPDLLNFALALQKNTILKRAYKELFTSGKYPIRASDQKADQPQAQTFSTAYGAEERIVNNRRIFGHGGAAPVPGGISTNLSIYPELDWVAVILNNYYIDIAPFLELQDRLITGAACIGG